MPKSLKEQIAEIVYERNLTSYMNNTKWREFFYAMENEMPFPPPYESKTLFEDDKFISKFKKCKEIGCLGDYSDETLREMCCWSDSFSVIEYIAVKPYYYEKQGGILAYKKILHNAEKEFILILQKYSIPYEIEEDNFIIYGYKGDSQ